MDTDTHGSMAYRTPIAIDGKLGRAHFAHISVDIEGSLHLQCSESIAKTFEGSLSLRLADIFLKAVAMSDVCSPITQVSYDQATTGFENPSPSPQTTNTTQKTGPDDKGRTQDSLLTSPSPSIIGPPRPETSPVWDASNLEPKSTNVWSKENIIWRPEVAISVKDHDFLRVYYTKAFQNLQQTNCRALAKAWIKPVEPRKQVCYPYNGRAVIGGVIRQLDPDAVKPPWWPAGVRHREPDHLLKEERIRLLVHLLGELHNSHGLTAKRLREADQPIRRYIVPEARLCILDEVYRVRQEELEYSEGKSDGQRQVLICRINLPEAATTFNDDKHNRGNISASNTPSACIKSGSISNAPPVSFAQVANIPAPLPHEKHYDMQGHYSERYAILDPKTTCGFGISLPMPVPLHGLKRKRESKWIAEAETTIPTMSPHEFSPAVTTGLHQYHQYPVDYYGRPCSSLQHSLFSPGPLTRETLAQPNEECDNPYNIEYL